MIKVLNLPAQLKQLIQSAHQTNKTKLQNLLVQLLKLSKEIYPLPYVANNRVKQSTLLSANTSKVYYDIYKQHMSDKSLDINVPDLIRNYKWHVRLGTILNALETERKIDLILATYDVSKKVFVPLKRFTDVSLHDVKPIIALDLLSKSLVLGNSPAFIVTSDLGSGEYVIDSYPHHLMHAILELLHGSDLPTAQLRSIQQSSMYSPRLIGLILLADKLTEKYNNEFSKVDQETHKNIVRSYLTIGYTKPAPELIIPVILNWHLLLSALEVSYITLNQFGNRQLDKAIFTYYLLLRPVIQIVLEHVNKDYIYDLTYEYEPYWQLYYDADLNYPLKYQDVLDLLYKINAIVNKPQKALTTVLQEYAAKQKLKLSALFDVQDIQYLQTQFSQIKNFVSMLRNEQNSTAKYLTVDTPFALGVLSYDLTREEDILVANFTLPINLQNAMQKTKAEFILQTAITENNHANANINFDHELVLGLNMKIHIAQEALYAFTENNLERVPVYTFEKLRRLLKLYAKYSKADNIDHLFLRYAQLTQDEQSMFKQNLVSNFLRTGLIDIDALTPKTVVMLAYTLLFNLTESEFKTLIGKLSDRTVNVLYERAVDLLTKLSAYLMTTQKQKSLQFKILTRRYQSPIEVVLARRLL